MPRFLLCVLLMALLIAAGCGPSHSDQTGAAASVHYTCPMHPQVESDKPGVCPICHMDLVKKEVAPTIYTCPMHPQIESDKPGVCPICHMDLVRKETKQASSGSMPGLELDLQKQVLAGIATVRVAERPLVRAVIAYSLLELPEPARKFISARFNGRIERLHVNQAGIPIRAGQPLFSFYSPELFQAQQDYLLAADRGRGGEEMKNAAVSRLRLFGLTEGQIEELAARNSAAAVLDYLSPAGGTILDKKIREGQYFNEGMTLYEVADLTSLWNIAEVPEQEIAGLKKGLAAEIRLSAWPGEIFPGQINWVSPVVDSRNRTVQVRSTVGAAGGKLKPNMYGETTFLVDQGRGVLVPKEAILFTGSRNLVYVEESAGRYQARTIELGSRFGEFFQVRSGLEAGEIIVASGGYLVDSESQLKGIEHPTEHAPGNRASMQGDPALPVVAEQEEALLPAAAKMEQPLQQTAAQKALAQAGAAKSWNAVCPVMGNEVDAELETATYQGKVYGFCCPGCREKFIADPARYASRLSADGKTFMEEE